MHKRYRLKKYMSGMTNLVPVAGGTNTRLGNFKSMVIQNDIKFKKGLWTTFKADTGAITDVDQNLLYMYVWQDFYDDGTNVDMTFRFDSVMRYTDG